MCDFSNYNFINAMLSNAINHFFCKNAFRYKFKTSLLLLLFIFSISIANANSSLNSLQTNKQVILILGDSLSSGHGIPRGKNWTDLLQKRLLNTQSNTQIINASISGDTSANGLNRLTKAIQQFQPTIIIIELGGNDALRGMPIKHIRQNLEAIIQQAQQSQAKTFLMAVRIPPNYGKKYTQAFERIYPKLAKQYEIPLIPFILNDIALKSKLMQIDGIHPNEHAQPAILEIVWKSLESTLKNL